MCIHNFEEPSTSNYYVAGIIFPTIGQLLFSTLPDGQAVLELWPYATFTPLKFFRQSLETLA